MLNFSVSQPSIGSVYHKLYTDEKNFVNFYEALYNFLPFNTESDVQKTRRFFGRSLGKLQIITHVYTYFEAVQAKQRKASLHLLKGLNEEKKRV